jgi:hypothetical protein
MRQQRVSVSGILVAALVACTTTCDSGDDGASSASARFCADYNNLDCQRLFECTPEAERREPFFVALFGSSAGECAKRMTDLCRHPKPDIQADVTCSDGASINASKATMCLDRVRTATCAELEQEETRAVCTEVCGPSAGAGGSGGGSTGGAGGTGGPAGDAEKVKLCRDMVDALCRRIFDCFTPAERADPLFRDGFGSTAAECSSKLAADCTINGPRCTTLNRTLAQLCLVDIAAISCASLQSGNLAEPASCQQACPIGGGSGGVGGTGGGGTGGSGGAGGAPAGGAGGGPKDGPALDGPRLDADTDAKSCTPANANFDCPVYTACDPVTRRCTSKCSPTQPCHGGCCLNGTCVMGLADTTCGREGRACTSCTSATSGRRCLMYPDQDSPSRPGGHCSCNDAADCPSAIKNRCETTFGVRRCCAPAGASCSVAEDCCSQGCVFGQCG